MNDVEFSKSGETLYLTTHAFYALKFGGCPHCSRQFIEREHPEFGGKFWGCPAGCRNAQNAPVSLSWTPEKKRIVALKATHPYKGTGF